MQTYIYTTKTGKTGINGGRIRRFYVMRMKHNRPTDIGSFKINTASYVGDLPSVRTFIFDWNMRNRQPANIKTNIMCVGEF